MLKLWLQKPCIMSKQAKFTKKPPVRLFKSASRYTLSRNSSFETKFKKHAQIFYNSHNITYFCGKYTRKKYQSLEGTGFLSVVIFYYVMTIRFRRRVSRSGPQISRSRSVPHPRREGGRSFRQYWARGPHIFR